MGGLNWTKEQYEEYLKRTGVADKVHEHSPIPNKVKDILAKNMSGTELHSMQMRIDPPQPKFKSKVEKRAWEEWIPTTGCERAHYEAIRVYLNSGSYRPDFALRMPNRELWLIEVKGSWDAYKSGRSSKKSLIEASRMFWWLGRWFSLLPKKGGGWQLEEYKL